VIAIMTPKLIARSLQQGKLLTQAELVDINIRASRAFEEIQSASAYSDIIVNHDGEDSLNWLYTPPLGEAGKTLLEFYNKVTG
jgi:guanylate kinase